MKSQTAFKQFVLGPGKEVTVAVTGSFFFLDSVNGDVSVRFDTGNFSRMISGSEIECQPGDYFTNITFRSDVGTGGATVTGYYYAGTLRVGNRFPVVYTRPAPNYIVPRTALLLNTDTFDIPATNTRTGQRFADPQISQWIFATTAVSYFEVYDTASNVLCGRIASSGNELFEVASALTIKAIGDCTYAIASKYLLPT